MNFPRYVYDFIVALILLVLGIVLSLIFSDSPLAMVLYGASFLFYLVRGLYDFKKHKKKSNAK